MKINFVAPSRYLLLFLLVISLTARPALAGCDGWGGSGGNCGGGVPVGGYLVIPATFPDGQPVTSIAPGAFQGNDALLGVTIPDTVTNIGASAFASCRSLYFITMGNGVTHIGPRAFELCLNLTNIAFSTNVAVIGDGAFYQCSLLPNLTLPNSVTSIGSLAFDACARVPSVVIPRGVTNIGESPFARCLNMTSITVSSLNLNYSSLNGALFNRSNTTRTVLIQCPAGKTGTFLVPNTVTTIGAGAFLPCNQLTAITLPTGLRSIGDRAFLGCTVNNLSLSTNLVSIGDSAFRDSGLTNIVIPDSVTNLGPRAFESCDGLLRAQIGNGVPIIGDRTFTACYYMTDVTIGTNVTRIGESAFGGSSLASITIPNIVTSIGSFAFQDSWYLTNVMIPRSVTSIGDVPFWQCYNLNTINVDPLNPAYTSVDTVLFTKDLATLVQCPSAKSGSYIVPTGVKRIGVWAFGNYNTNLTSITLPDSLVQIGDQAFGNCQTLTNVIIGNSITRIGNEAFFGCDALEGVYFRSDAPQFGSDVFTFNNRVKIFYLPGTTGWSTTFAGRPTALWLLPNPVILNNSLSFGVGPDGFNFIISWATNTSVVVEAQTQIATSGWSPVATNTLADGWSLFSDPEWANHPNRFYRVRSQ